jgi:hypothetical protein
MGRGGKRPNSGRKPEAIRRKQAQIVASVLDTDLTPLAVMHRAMMEHVHAGNWDEAAKQAKEVAPYVHPKLTSIQHKGDPDEPLVHTIAHVIVDPSDTDGEGL